MEEKMEREDVPRLLFGKLVQQAFPGARRKPQEPAILGVHALRCLPVLVEVRGHAGESHEEDQVNIYSWLAIIIFDLSAWIRYEVKRAKFPEKPETFGRTYWWLLLWLSVFTITVMVMSTLIARR